MDDLISMFDNLIKISKEKYIKSNNKKHDSWKYCVALEETGWKIESYSKTINSDDLIIFWRKEDKTIEIKMSFFDQVLWYKWKENKNNVV